MHDETTRFFFLNEDLRIRSLVDWDFIGDEPSWREGSGSCHERVTFLPFRGLSIRLLSVTTTQTLAIDFVSRISLFRNSDINHFRNLSLWLERYLSIIPRICIGFVHEDRAAWKKASDQRSISVMLFLRPGDIYRVETAGFICGREARKLSRKTDILARSLEVLFDPACETNAQSFLIISFHEQGLRIGYANGYRGNVTMLVAFLRRRRADPSSTDSICVCRCDVI